MGWTDPCQYMNGQLKFFTLMTHILLVDDDNELTEMLGQYLEAEGFRVSRASDGEAGVRLALSGEHQAVVLDVMMPRLDGFECLRRIRAHSTIPVLMLTAKGDEVDRIVGLEIGADDYLPKPFNPRELIARLRAILRRAQGQDADTRPGVIHIGALEIHPNTRRATAHGQPLELTSTEFNLLLTLCRHAGEVVSKEALSQQALGRPLARYDRSIDMHLSNLRKKLAPHGLDETILTVRRQGYQLAG